MKKLLWGAIAVLLVVVLALGVRLAYQQGYNEGWNAGTANGWQGCIEENNLYERYKED